MTTEASAPFELEPCVCGSTRLPDVWLPKGRGSNSFCLRCASCGFVGGASTDHRVVRVKWNFAVRIARDERARP